MTVVRELISRVRFALNRASVKDVNSAFINSAKVAQQQAGQMNNAFRGVFRPLTAEMLDFNNRLKEVGQNLTMRLTLPIVAFGGFALRASTQFDEAMNRVNAVTGATSAQFTLLNDKAKELGSTTAFSASEVAQGMGFLAQAGLEVNDVLGAINPALQLAAAGQLSLAEAADISTNVLTQFRLSTEDLNSVNDVLAKTATSTNTSVKELGEGFAYAGGVAKSAGLSVLQTSQYLGAMANTGVKGSRAGTALSSSLSRLMQASSGVGRMAKITNEQFESFGISISDFQTATGEIDLTALLKKLSQFSDRSDFAGRIMRIFGEEAGRTFLSLASAPDILDDVIGKTNEFNNAASEMQQKMMAGLPGAMKTLKSTFESLQIAFIDSIKPVLIPLISALSSLFAAFNKLQPETQRIVGSLVLLAASLGPVLMAITFFAPLAGKMIASLMAIRAAIMATNLSVLIMPALIIGAIALVGLAIDDLFAFIKGRPSITGELIRQSGGDVERMRAFVSQVWEEFKWLFGMITDGWKKLFGGEVIEAGGQLLDGMRTRIANSKLVPDFIKDKTLGLQSYRFPEAQAPDFDKDSSNNKDSLNNFELPKVQVPNFIKDSLNSLNNLELPKIQIPDFIKDKLPSYEFPEAQSPKFENQSQVSVSPTVNVNVSNTNASPEQIGQAVQQAIEPNLQKTARQLRQNNENVYEN